MVHILYIDPVTGDDVECCEDEERERAKHWKEVASTLASLVIEEHDYAIDYAWLVTKAT